MYITPQQLNSILAIEDIEGYINFGAPNDEYESEAEMIASAINQLKKSEFTFENIIAIVVLVWMKNFNLGNEDIALRQEALGRVAQFVLES